jgi:hypothetical protein
MARRQFNVRLPDFSIQQVDSIAKSQGLTNTQIFILAIDRLYVALEGSPGYEKATLSKSIKRVRKKN